VRVGRPLAVRRMLAPFPSGTSRRLCGAVHTQQRPAGDQIRASQCAVEILNADDPALLPLRKPVTAMIIDANGTQYGRY
jgi:hypothetical protein